MSASDKITTTNNSNIKDFLILRLERMHSYHDHKENMAHAGTLVMFALTAAILGLCKWPPQWVPTIYISERIVALIAIFIIWLFIHIYIRWQLRNRRIAAMYVVSILKFLKELSNYNLSENDLKPYGNKEDLKPLNVKFPKNTKKSDFFDRYILPSKKVFLIADDDIKGYPVKVVAEMINSKIKVIEGELLVSLGSIFMLLIIIFRSFQ